MMFFFNQDFRLAASVAQLGSAGDSHADVRKFEFHQHRPS